VLVFGLVVVVLMIFFVANAVFVLLYNVYWRWEGLINGGVFLVVVVYFFGIIVVFLLLGCLLNYWGCCCIVIISLGLVVVGCLILF